MSLQIGRLFGINLFVHWSFWLLPLWVVYSHSAETGAERLALHLILLGALFAFVVLHEYGHALAARFFGIATRDITLYPIGGVARLERMSERPWEEFCIALAGPLVNVALALILAVGLFAATLIQPGFPGGTAGELVVILLAMNVFLFLFNLLPAFPMDGGRVLRALLTFPMGRLRATRVSVYIGIGLALLIGAFALNERNPMLLFVGLFVIWAGWQELASLSMRERDRERDTEATSPEILPNASASPWRSFPQPPVTVYLWDGRKRQWIAQGAIPTQHVGSHGRRVD